MRALIRFSLAIGLYCACAGLSGQTVSAQSDKSPAKPDVPQTGASKPGRDRWQIKTASDADAKEINHTPVKSTVESLFSLPRPVDMPMDSYTPFFQEHRARPAETTVWTIEADVTDCRLMPDGDYRVTLKGASGKTMVLEMPNPAPEYVDPQSPFAADLKTARGQFDNKFQPEKASKPVSGHARITGIGFFGRAYGGKKTEGNLIQLHPVLNVEWLDKPTEEFVVPKETPAKPVTKATAPVTKPEKPTKSNGKQKPTGH